ncbi:RagB/SusD family nutrient uptake outer membrane protein [Pedobacter nyackensis]|uniref:RagB/SusD family nutrient uptake outer membrane protein n=1 Tax=Pedobacter nyackensis TaxID=475255 RepID=UPI002930496B|nr:RagB/SusD family nutrient uptake outer membrane protein [Pedobacter nyackensis]
MKKYYFILTSIFLTGLLGCKKLTEAGLPVNDLISKAVFQSDETASSAITGIYARMMDDINATPLYISWYSALAADEVNTTLTSGNFLQLYKNDQSAQTALTNIFWNGGYNFIYRANAVIEGVNQSTAMTTTVRQQLLGEAYFIRAFWHFYMVNFYGDVPIILTTDYEANAKAGRAATTDVYKQIILDLQESKKLLTEKYVDGNSVSESPERVRPNTYAASALLSRVYLYSGNVINAEIEADRVISKTALYELESIDRVFLKESKEAIWQLSRPLPAPEGTVESEYFIIRATPGAGLTGSTTISDALLERFAVNDLRRSSWIGTYTDNSISPANDYHFPYKYKADGTSAEKEYSIVFRLAEQYLIRAEARAQQGKLDLAMDDIDVILVRANQPKVRSVLPSATKEDLLDIILNERGLEFFTEWGHRWLDLKRCGKIDGIMPDVSLGKGGVWESYMKLWPIPQNDVDNSKNLIQNLGYN